MASNAHPINPMMLPRDYPKDFTTLPPYNQAKCTLSFVKETGKSPGESQPLYVTFLSAKMSKKENISRVLGN